MGDDRSITSAFCEPGNILNLPIHRENLEIEEILWTSVTMTTGNCRSEDLPSTNRIGSIGEGAVVYGLSPDQWLIFGEYTSVPDMVTTDHSDAWAVLRVSGDDAIKIMQALSPVDMHPSVFGDDACFQTNFGGNRVLVARTPGAKGVDCYDLIIQRSSARAVLEDVYDMAVHLRDQT